MHGRCCTGSSSRYPGPTMYANTCFATLPPWIWKPSFWVKFLTGSHGFTISFLKNVQGTSPYIWRPTESGCINFLQLATFITQNRLLYITRRCAPYGCTCGVDVVEDEFHSYTEKRFCTIRRSDTFWGIYLQCISSYHKGWLLKFMLYLNGDQNSTSLDIFPCRFGKVRETV